MVRSATPLLILSFIILVWQLAGSYFEIVAIIVSTPIKSFKYASENYSDLLLDFGHTALIALAGFLLALCLASALAFAGIIFKQFGRFLVIISSLGQTLPVIVLVPIFVIVFGAGPVSKISLAAVMSFFAILLSLIINLRSVEKEYAETFSFFDPSRVDKFTMVLIPVSFATVLGALRVGAGLAVLGAVVAEFTGSSYGLGKNIFLTSVRLEPELLVCSILLTILLGLFVHVVFRSLEMRYDWTLDKNL